MIALRNNVSLIGRLAADITLSKTKSDIPVCNFSIAVNRPGANKEDKPDFFDCVAWRGTAENIAKYFSKGDGIGIIGSLQTDTYQDNNGNNRKKVEVLVDSFEFLPGRKQGDGRQAEATAPEASQPVPQPVPVDTENLPFDRGLVYP